MSAKTIEAARIAGDKRINEVMDLMKAMSDDGCAVVLNKAKDLKCDVSATASNCKAKLDIYATRCESGTFGCSGSPMS